jgi:hypothetical protein
MPRRKVGDISDVRYSGPSLGEDGTGVGVDLGEADCSPSGPFEPQIESTGSAEE